MSFNKSLPVRYHQQDGTFYCGPACAQMVLHATGAGPFTQSDLEAEMPPPFESGWSTTPDQLPPVLNANRLPTFPSSYALFETNVKDTLARKIVWSIYQYDTPVIALVYGRAHWLVVNGFETSAEPTGPADLSYSINSFDLRNPTKVPDSPPPPHSDTDLCGTGGEYGETVEDLLYAHWDYSFVSPVNPPSAWSGKYIAICDTDPPAPSIGAQPPPVERLPGDQIIPRNQAGELAIAGIKRHGLNKRGGWNEFLSGTSPGKPILVQRLDRRDTYYYIVPMTKKRAIPALVCIDGRYGNYQQAARTSDPGGNALGDLNFDPKVALKTALSKPIDLGRQGKLQLRPEACVIYPMLVWRPCRESMSPYLPFFMIIAGNRRIYVSVDGRVLPQLHYRDGGN
jgi:hypothetical protein